MEITIFALPVLLSGLFIRSKDKIILVFIICFLFGGTSTLSLSALGGAPILPAVLFFPFVLWKVVSDRSLKTGIDQLAYPNAGFWLTLLVVYEVFSAYALPRLFEDETMVYAADRGTFSGVKLLPLKPVSTNLTQSIYSILGLMTFLATSQLLNTKVYLICFRNSMLVVLFLDIFAALVQMGESYLGLPPILTELRNADYAMFGNYEEGGLLRIQGTFPEASGFSSFSLPLFAFAFSLFSQNAIPAYSGCLTLAIFSLLLLSTSSTAYFSLGAYLTCLFVAYTCKVFMLGSQLKIGKIAGIIWLISVVICIVCLVVPDVITVIADFFDNTVFNKLNSSSGIERSAWNWQGLTNVIDTYGVGVGFGSNRSSNFFVALISNVGAIGAILFAAFLWQIVTAKTNRLSLPELQIIQAAKHALFIWSFGAFAAAPFAEPGMMFYIFAAAATSGITLSQNHNLHVSIPVSAKSSFVPT